ncbi:uncharacterized protein [Halyomorpha halys]|uniref:uncharacterized protein n=1 Tax=Halyomorpha halys TaxID=286706 RepID=UPI0034D32D8C
MVRYLRHLIIGFLLFGVCQGDASLQRKKRWLVFPKGSSLQLVYCFLVSTFGTRDGIFVIGITVGLAWEIPQNFRSFLIKEAKEKIESRHRRELYSKIRLLLDRQGVDGMYCILRAICESKRVSGTKLKFIHSLLHGLFS